MPNLSCMLLWFPIFLQIIIIWICLVIWVAKVVYHKYSIIILGMEYESWPTIYIFLLGPSNSEGKRDDYCSFKYYIYYLLFIYLINLFLSKLNITPNLKEQFINMFGNKILLEIINYFWVQAKHIYALFLSSSFFDKTMCDVVSFIINKDKYNIL